MNFPTVTTPLIGVNVDQNIHLRAGKTFIVAFVHTKIQSVVLVVVVLALKKKKQQHKSPFVFLPAKLHCDLRCLETFSS